MKSRAFWTILLIVGTCLGCNRQPPIDRPNRRLIESLKTAVSAKNSKWLEENEKVVEARHKEGKLSDSEYEALESIIREASGGNWALAADDCRTLAKVQDWSR